MKGLNCVIDRRPDVIGRPQHGMIPDKPPEWFEVFHGPCNWVPAMYSISHILPLHPKRGRS